MQFLLFNRFVDVSKMIHWLMHAIFACQHGFFHHHFKISQFLISQKSLQFSRQLILHPVFIDSRLKDYFSFSIGAYLLAVNEILRFNNLYINKP